MKKTTESLAVALLSLLILIVVSQVGFANTISWDAASGILPDDASIPPELRFAIVNYSPFVSFQNGFLNITDTSAGLEVDIIKEDIIPTSSDQDWLLEVELRMNSHNRPNLDWGAIVGVVTEDKWIMLLISENGIGFEDDGNVYLNGVTYDMDTTDDFHTYRVEKISALLKMGAHFQGPHGYGGRN